MASFSHLEARVGLILLIGAMAPYACHAVGNLMLTLCLRCCCGLTRNQLQTTMIGDKIKELSIIHIRTGCVSWTKAKKIQNLSKRAAMFVSIVRLVFWHWLQPLSYAFVLYAYWDLLDEVQMFLALAVGLRECVYFLLTIACLWVTPAFLMVDLRSTYLYYSWWYVVQYVISPVKFVCSTLIRTLNPPIHNEHMMNTGQYVNGSIKITAEIVKTEEQIHRRCCMREFRCHDVTITVLALLDLCGIAALVIAIHVNRVYVALVIGYVVTFLDGAFIAVYYSTCCCKRKWFPCDNFDSFDQPQMGIFGVPHAELFGRRMNFRAR